MKSCSSVRAIVKTEVRFSHACRRGSGLGSGSGPVRGVLARNGIHCVVVAEQRRRLWRTLVEAVPCGQGSIESGRTQASRQAR